MADRLIKYRFVGDVSGLRSSTRAAGNDVRGLGTQLQAAGRHTVGLGTRMRRMATGTAGLVAAFGIGKVIKDSINLEKQFSKTMAQIKVATSAPAGQMRQLDALAQKLGADTVFSANEAADAMLELAKGGLTPAQIQAGALKNSLTLAAAGGLELGTAANTVVQTMGAFGLKAKQTGAAVAALAGAANASSADVSDITQALRQAGTSAHAAGLSVQETTAILAAFADKGIQGSDAGTSLRTMLTRLVPQTASARKEMDRLHLSFTNANGEFVSGAGIAQRLQDAYKGMSAAEKTKSIQTIFGSDAQRAANVLINEGASGVRHYEKSTRDLSQAQKLAKANMSGTAGALEQLSGAVDTAELALGKALAPTVRHLAGFLTNSALPAVTKFINEMRSGQGVGGAVARDLDQIWQAGGKVVNVMGDVAKAFDSLPSFAKQTIAVGAVGGFAAKKLGLLPTIGKGVGAALGSKAGVTPVFVTNPGFGKVGPGGVPVPGGTTKGAAAEGGGWKALLAAIPKFAPAFLTVGDKGNEVKGPGDKGFDKNDPIGKRVAQYKQLDAVLQKLSYKNATRGAAAFWQAQQKIGLTTNQMRLNFPKTTKALHEMGQQGKQTGADVSKMAHTMLGGLSGFGKALDKIDKKNAKPKVSLNTTQAQKKGIELGGQIDKLGGKNAKPKATLQDKATHGLTALNKLLGVTGAKNATPSATLQNHASGPLAAIQSQLASLNGKRADSYVYLHHITVNSVRGNPGGGVARDKYGNAIADGGFFTGSTRRMASGGYTDSGAFVPRVPQMRRGGGNILWSEPETGWEAYISGKPGMRNRNLTILSLAAERLGASVVKRASGGITPMAGGGVLGDLDFKHTVKGMTRELRKLTEALKNTRTARKEYAKNVSQAYITDPFGGTLGGFDSQVAYETKRLRGARADLTTLRKHGLNGPLYKALAASGNATLIDQFSHLSRSQIAARESAYRGRARLSTAIGEQAATAVYGQRLHTLAQETRELRRELHRLRTGHHIGNTHIGRQINNNAGGKNRGKAARKLRHS